MHGGTYMALPHDHDIQYQLLLLLDEAPDGTMHCQDIYRELATRFPQLTPDDVEVPFANSCSHWANRGQWARHHLLLQGHLVPQYLTGRGFWTISDGGRAYVRDVIQRAHQLLRELDDLP